MGSEITREPLRTKVRRVLLDRILTGELKPESRIKEAKLCEDFGISRTPLREALLKLHFEGFLESVPGHGFSVRPLDRETASELITIAGQMEAVAVRLTDEFSPEQLEALRRTNDERKAKMDDLRAEVQADREWHAKLVENCGNRRLIQLLDQVRTRLARFAQGFVKDTDRVEIAVAQHEQIMEALAAGNRELALERLEEHWEMAMEDLPPAQSTDGGDAGAENRKGSEVSTNDR